MSCGVRGPSVSIASARCSRTSPSSAGRRSPRCRSGSRARPTVVGVNGDLFRWADGKPSGILLRDGVLVSPPYGQRSSAGISLDGTLDVRRVKFFGTWRGSGQRRALNELNKEPGKNGIALFTADYGAPTPRLSGSVAVTLAGFPASTPNTDIGDGRRVSQNGSVGIASGTAVLVARGVAAAKLQAEAQIGATMTLRLILQPGWDTVGDAIGGGPVLVRSGRPCTARTKRSRRRSSRRGIRGRRSGRPRTGASCSSRSTAAVRLLGGDDDLRDGADARSSRRRARHAAGRRRLDHARVRRDDPQSPIGPDGGRPISTALMLFYYGIYAPPPLVPVVSPNGDGVRRSRRSRSSSFGRRPYRSR